jgi:hypothetical protein
MVTRKRDQEQPAAEMEQGSIRPDDSLSLGERIELDYAKAWLPEEGETLVGIVTELQIGTSDYGQYPILVVQPEVGDRRSVHAFHTVLHDRLLELMPDVGEEIAFKYMGRVLPKNAKAGATVKDDGYESYRVIVDRPTINMWEKLAFKKDRPES